MSKPDCFPSQKMFDQWKRIAKVCNEDATPCVDCDEAYRRSVGDLCDTTRVSKVFFVEGRSSIMREQKLKVRSTEERKEVKKQYDHARNKAA